MKIAPMIENEKSMAKPNNLNGNKRSQING